MIVDILELIQKTYMKQLSRQFSRKGILYTMLDRSENVAFYSCKYNRPDSTAVWYEVFEIPVAAPREFHGVTVEGGEYFPSDEAFATKIKAKTFFLKGALERAKSFFTEMNSTERQNTRLQDNPSPSTPQTQIV